MSDVEVLGFDKEVLGFEKEVLWLDINEVLFFHPRIRILGELMRMYEECCFWIAVLDIKDGVRVYHLPKPTRVMKDNTETSELTAGHITDITYLDDLPPTDFPCVGALRSFELRMKVVAVAEAAAAALAAAAAAAARKAAAEAAAAVAVRKVTKKSHPFCCSSKR